LVSDLQRPVIKLLRVLREVVIWLTASLLHLWSLLALVYASFPAQPALRMPLVATYGLGIWLAITRLRPHKKGLLLSLLGFVAVAAWFITIRPKTDAIYPEGLAMPSVVFNDNQVTIHNVRNSVTTTLADFNVRYETRTYDLDKLRSVDFLVNYWGMDLIAHTFLSFGFSDGEYVAVSIEFRPEIGEHYDMLKGFFKQYELIYIWGDENDLVGSRTVLQGEDVYLYRTRLTPEEGRKLFVSMLRRTQALHDDPKFYNTCTQSCTNTISDHLIQTGIYNLPFWKRRFLTGDVDRHTYNEGVLVTDGLPFEELRQKALVNDRAMDAGNAPGFSQRIRTHLP